MHAQQVRLRCGMDSSQYRCRPRADELYGHPVSYAHAETSYFEPQLKVLLSCTCIAWLHKRERLQ